jgi:hypothetical protein
MKTFPLAVSLFGLCASSLASTNVTLWANTTNNTYNVCTGCVAKVVSFNTEFGPATIFMSKLSGTNVVTSIRIDYAQYVTNKTSPVVVGPSGIILSGSSATAMATVEISSPDDYFVPSTGVVIPSDSNGPVNIILESSSDLLNWTPANPGIYGTSTTKRFFRVRAERNP